MIATVSIVTQPDEYTSVFAINGSHLYYQSVSASASAPAFQYVFNTYTIDQFNQTYLDFVGQFYAPPRPITGDGIFTPYRALQTYINNEPVDFNVTLQGITAVSASMVEYITDYGFQYNPSLEFSTYDFDFFFGSLLGLTFSTDPGLLIGDQITILMGINQFNPQYNTTTNIFGVGATTSGYYAITGLPYGNTPSINEFGTITNQLRIVGTGATAWAWNGTRQYDETENYINEFVLTGSDTNQFLTNYKNYVWFGSGNPTFSLKPILRNQYETIGFISDPSSPINGINIITFDAVGNQLSNTTHGATGMNYPYRKYELGIGTQNLIDAYGIDFANCAYYEVILYETSGFENRGWILRMIDYTCLENFYTNYQISWLNPRGSYEYWNFYKDSQEMVNITTSEIRKVLPWNYTLGNRERTVLTQQVQKSYKINTNWITQNDYNFLQELFYSAEVYWIDSNHNRIPIMITDKQWTSKSYARDDIFNLSLTFEYSSLTNIQSN